MRPYFLRLRSLVDALDVLENHPEGLPVLDLAERIGVDVDQLTEDLSQLISVEVPDSRALQLSAGVAFVDESGEWVDPPDATRVRLVDNSAQDALGLNLFSPGEAFQLVQIGRQAAKGEGNPHLDSALDKLEEALLSTRPDDSPEGIPALDDLRVAIETHRKLRIVYSKAWHPALVERTIEPLRLVLVDGSWELDAGPILEDGDIRSYLVGRIREWELLDDTFEPDDAVARCLSARRGTADIKLFVPIDVLWLLETVADGVTVSRYDSSGVEVDVTIREPVESRLATVLCAMGPDAFVVEPEHFKGVQQRWAKRLLATAVE